MTESAPMVSTLFPILKSLHVTCALLTVGGFLLRLWWKWSGSRCLQHPLTRVLPHLNDTLLLGAGIGMVVLLHQYPFQQAWLTAKLLALGGYILLGSVALKRGRTPVVRAIAGVAAVATVGYILAVAITRRPWPFPG